MKRVASIVALVVLVLGCAGSPDQTVEEAAVEAVRASLEPDFEAMFVSLHPDLLDGTTREQFIACERSNAQPNADAFPDSDELDIAAIDTWTRSDTTYVEVAVEVADAVVTIPLGLSKHDGEWKIIELPENRASQCV